MAIKALVDRPRPPLRYPEPKTLVPLPHDGSFPSGHAATSFAAATNALVRLPAVRAGHSSSRGSCCFLARVTSASTTRWTSSAALRSACVVRYSSSPARKSRCNDGQRGEQADEDPDPAPVQPKNSSGTSIRRIRTKIVESAPSAITHEALRDGCRKLDTGLPQNHERQHGQADEEDELADACRCASRSRSWSAPRPSPTYQPVNAEMARTSPDTQVS
jgi:hypothetical protein